MGGAAGNAWPEGCHGRSPGPGQDPATRGNLWGRVGDGYDALAIATIDAATVSVAHLIRFARPPHCPWRKGNNPAMRPPDSFQTGADGGAPPGT
jgi:hypothetical protein